MMPQSGYWAQPWLDVTWALGVPGACDEGSVGADAGAWLGGFGGVVGIAVGIGLLAVATYVVVKVATNQPLREKVAAGGRRVYRYARGR
jgi:heme exporter protein D